MLCVYVVADVNSLAIRNSYFETKNQSCGFRNKLRDQVKLQLHSYITIYYIIAIGVSTCSYM